VHAYLKYQKIAVFSDILGEYSRLFLGSPLRQVIVFFHVNYVFFLDCIFVLVYLYSCMNTSTSVFVFVCDQVPRTVYVLNL